MIGPTYVSPDVTLRATSNQEALSIHALDIAGNIVAYEINLLI